jgi:hypothetical protein
LSYVTEEFESELILLKCAERSAAEEALPHHPEPVTIGFALSGVADAEIGISDGFEISSIVVAGGPPTVVKGTGVFRQVGSAAEGASPDSTEVITNGTVFSDLEDSGVSDGYETSSAVVGSPAVGMGIGVSQLTTHQRPKIEDDTMPYAYPKYYNHPDSAVHVKKFRSIWAVNHGTQGLSLTKCEQSMIVDFQLSLEGQAARCRSVHGTPLQINRGTSIHTIHIIRA